MRQFIDIINESIDETKLERLIRHAFEKIKIEINYNNFSVMIDPDTREAEVRLESEEITLDHLNRLKETGLSDAYTVRYGANSLVIAFIVSDNLDHAVLL